MAAAACHWREMVDCIVSGVLPIHNRKHSSMSNGGDLGRAANKGV